VPHRPPIHQPRRCEPRPRERRSAAQRGYGAAWQRYRLTFLAAHPWCVECERQGRMVPATDVDHIVPIDGPNDPRFWDATNHEGKCHSHHSQKTATHDGGFGRPSS